MTPKAYTPAERLSADNAAHVLIDHQAGLLSARTDIPAQRLRHNILGLAKIGTLFGLPIVLTQGGYGGRTAGGPLLAEIIETFPDVPLVDCHFPRASDDMNFRSEIERAGRRKLIPAGCKRATSRAASPTVGATGPGRRWQPSASGCPTGTETRPTTGWARSARPSRRGDTSESRTRSGRAT